ncbi:nucleotidyltransferase domain-containing protein [Candidatus Woesearchaeota archaeon]|nr:nucleotidyltransferase domain-containing protein [Candidatus Woesearchaeota archaeon]
MKPEDKVYRAFYKTKEKKLYFNQIKELTGLSDSSLSNTLKKLKNKKEAKKYVTKAHTFYELIDKELKILNFMRFDLDKFNNLNREIRIPLQEFLKKIPFQIAFVILFGSSAKKQEQKNSDIDLLITLFYFNKEKLYKLYFEEMKIFFSGIKKEIDALSIHPLSLAFVDLKTYRTSKDYLILEAKNKGFPIFGHVNYYKVNYEDH